MGTRAGSGRAPGESFGTTAFCGLGVAEGLAGPPPGLSVALACIIAIAIVTSGIWMTAV